MARLTRLFRTLPESLTNNPIAADMIVFGIISDDFLFFTENMVLCSTHYNRHVEAILMRIHNILHV